MKEVASIVFLNRKRQILLQLRDDKPTIPYPNMWTLPGGSLEEGETPEHCIIREMQEEMGLELQHFKPFVILIKKPDFIEYVFQARMTFNVNTIDLQEGQCIQWFTEEEIHSMLLAFEGNIIVRTFWRSLKENANWSFPSSNL